MWYGLLVNGTLRKVDYFVVKSSIFDFGGSFSLSSEYEIIEVYIVER